MIRAEIRREWKKHPRRVIASTVATLLAVPVIWLYVVAYLVGLS